MGWNARVVNDCYGGVIMLEPQQRYPPYDSCAVAYFLVFVLLQ